MLTTSVLDGAIARLTWPSSSSLPLTCSFVFLGDHASIRRASAISISKSMANDTALRSSLICLAAIILFVGLTTRSFKKMMVTYVVGMLGIAGVLLPDWAYFDRDFSRWTSAVTGEERASHIARSSGLKRLRIYPMRAAIYTTVYGLALYKWWMFVSK